MTMQYDFDMFSICPDEVQAQFQDKFNELGLSPMMAQQVALFRDPRVVEALRNADEVVKQFWLDSGFGINVYHSGAPSGRYPARDENPRNSRVQRLTENLKDRDLKGANWGGFEFTEFVAYLRTAEPMDEIDIAKYQAEAAPVPIEKPKNILAKIGLAIGLVTVVYTSVQVLA